MRTYLGVLPISSFNIVIVRLVPEYKELALSTEEENRTDAATDKTRHLALSKAVVIGPA